MVSTVPWSRIGRAAQVCSLSMSFRALLLVNIDLLSCLPKSGAVREVDIKLSMSSAQFNADQLLVAE